METDFYRSIAIAQAERAGLSGLTRLLMKKIQYPVIIADHQGRVLSWQCPANFELALDDLIALPSSLRELKSIPAQGIMAVKGKRFNFLGWPIGQERTLGYLLILSKAEIPKSIYHFAEIISLAAMVELSQQREIAERERVYRDEFVRDIIFNNFDGIDDLIRSGKVWGCDFTASHIVLVIEILREGRTETVNWPEIRTEIESFFAERAFACIIGKIAHYFVVLLPCPKLEQINWHVHVRGLYAELTQKFTSGILQAGVGLLYENINMLYRSYQQAKVALELGKIIPEDIRLAFFDELGAVRLFYNQSEQDLDDFFKESVGCLAEFDRENNGSLLLTLWHYLRSNQDVNAAKAKLFIHRNTLRYRLKKIEEILGADLNNTETRFNLYAALKVGAILGKIETQITK